MKPLQVLLLEDSSLDAELTENHLKKIGLICDMTRVETETEFREALSSRRFELILSDYSLPSFDGGRALEITRELSLDLPFIFVSGVLGEDVAIDSLRHGATDYVVKHRLERLGPAIKRALAEQSEHLARLLTEATLRETEFRYRLLVDNVQEYALFMTDEDRRVTLWSNGAIRLFGYSENEALGRSIYQLNLACERQAPAMHSQCAGAVPNAESQCEDWLIRRDGTRFWASVITAPVKTVTNQLRGFVTVIRDNTERKCAEEERAALLESEQFARAEAEQRAAELTAANAALARSNGELEQFAFAASHDLQEPLRMVKSFTQMLARSLQGKLDPSQLEMLHFIETGTSRMHNLVQDLLSYSRVLHDREQDQNLVDLNQVFDQILFNFKDQIEEGHALVTRNSLPVVLASGERIGLVFQNLLSNALKYRSAQPPIIQVSALLGNAEWIIEVQDNGIGFDSQYAERIFGLFKRLHPASEYPGTGVGLALCKQIVEQHRGRTWASSELGKGSRFFFTLPEVKL